MAVRLTGELQRRIADDYDNGLSTKQLATKYDIPEPQIRRFCNEYEKFVSLAEALAKVGKEHPELRPNIVEKLYEMGVLTGKSNGKTAN